MAQKYKSRWTGPQVDSAVDQITDKIDRSEIGVAGGIASLGSDGKVPSWQLPTAKSVTADNFIGKDGITISKAADSERIEISGSGCVQKDTNTNSALLYARVLGQEVMRPFSYYPSPDYIPFYNANSTLKTNAPVEDNDTTNKKYVNDNYFKKTKISDVIVCCLTPDTTTSGSSEVYKGLEWYGNNTVGNIVSLSDKDQLFPGSSTEYTGDRTPVDKGTIIVPEPTRPYHAANKKYVDDAVAGVAESVSRYKHHVKFTFVSSTYNGSFFTDIYSNQNTVIDSLATLKTYLGNEFTKDLYGYLEYLGVYRLGSLVTDTTIFYIQDSGGGIKTQSISNFTISDTVTTI